MRYSLLMLYLSCLCILIPAGVNSSEPVLVHSTEERGDEQGLFHFLLGDPASDSIYLGMWSYHAVDDDESYSSTHNLIGITYKSVFAGTFENSHDNRAWAVGFQRDVYRTALSELSVDMGYRLGMMYGYEKLEIYDSGIFPLLQLYSDISYKKIGAQIAWAGSVVTAGLFLRF